MDCAVHIHVYCAAGRSVGNFTNVVTPLLEIICILSLGMGQKDDLLLGIW